MRPLNIKVLRDGSIPWSAEEYWAVIAERTRLHFTPHDDWKRDLGRIFVPDALGGPAVLKFNPDMPTNQVMDFIVKRYRGLDQDVVMSHMNRYMVMNEFLHDNMQRLIADDLIREKGDDFEEGQVGLHTAVVEVLAELRFITVVDEDGDERTTFDYDQVVQLARVRMKEGGDSEA